MSTKKMMYSYVFWQLLKTDLCVFKKIAIGRIIDTAIWVFSMLLVTSYILPLLGISSQFSFIVASGLIASGGIMAVYPNVVTMVADLEGDKIISYPLTLPLPSWLVLVKNIVYFSITSLTYSLTTIPMGKIFMWSQFSLSAINPGKFFIICFLTNLFCGAFALFLVCLIKDMSKLGHAWMRVVFPLWFFGGFQFSWSALHKALPWLAYIDLLNPFTYIFEGTRATMTTGNEYLSFEICSSMLIVSIIIFSISGIAALKKRLDFV